MLGLSIDNDLIHAAIVKDGGAAVSSANAATPDDSYRACLQTIADLVVRHVGNDRIKGSVGVAIPAVVREHCLTNSALPYLNGKNLQQDLQAALGCPIQLYSYGTCFTYYEAVHGAGIGANSLFGMHIDTHCTGGLVVNGVCMDGNNGIAGNWAHLPLPAPVPYETDGQICWCGRTGCMESFVSAASLEKDYVNITGNHLGIDAIAVAAQDSDIVAENVLQVLEDRLGRATAAIITLLDPDVIIIGGRIGQMERLIRNVPRKWPGYVTVKRPRTQLCPAKTGAHAAATGAAMLASG